MRRDWRSCRPPFDVSGCLRRPFVVRSALLRALCQATLHDRLEACLQRVLNLPVGNNRNLFGQEDRLLQLVGAIQGRIPAALGALEEWKNNTKESVAQKIPYFLYSLVYSGQNITKVEEAFEQKLPGLIRILEGKAPRILNIIQARLPQILDIVEQKLPQLLTEAEGALPDLIDNMDEVMSGVLDIIEERVPVLLTIIQEGLPPIMASLESSLPGILDVVEARMDGL